MNLKRPSVSTIKLKYFSTSNISKYLPAYTNMFYADLMT